MPAFYGPRAARHCVGDLQAARRPRAAPAGNGIMIAFKADESGQVHAAHAAALAAGGSTSGAPGFRPPEGTASTAPLPRSGRQQVLRLRGLTPRVRRDLDQI